MINKIVWGIAIAAALTSATQTAEAQKPVTVGIAGGISVPIGDLSDTHELGWNGTASVGLNFPASPVGVRFEGFYNSFEGEDNLPKITIAGASANALYHLGGQIIRPYVIGGVGAYSTKLQGFDSETDFGLNAGLGLKFGLGTLNTYAEARLHTVNTEDQLQYIPVIFGIEF